MESFSREKILTDAWKLFKENMVFLAGFFLFMMLLLVLPNLISGNIQTTRQEVKEVSFQMQLLIFIIQILAGFVIIRVVLYTIDGKDITLKSVFDSQNIFYKYVLISVVYDIAGIALVELMNIVRDFGLFLIVGFAFLALKFQFTTYILIDKKAGLIDAFRISNKITKNDMLNIFVFFMYLLFINIVGFFLFFVGLLITVPLSALAIALLYRELIKKITVIENA